MNTMNPEQSRKFNTAFGGVLLAAGAVAWLLAVYFAAVPSAPVPPLLAATRVDLASCRNALAELGYRADARENEVSAYEALTPLPRPQLDKASIAVNLCHLTLQSFCMGEGCNEPGLSFTLRRPAEAAVTAPVIATPVPATIPGLKAKPKG